MTRSEKLRNGSGRATSAEVARLAGVSRATVSLVLNNRAGEIGISADTGARVAAAAARLGYQPNHAARSLRRQRTNVIAFLLHSLDSFYNAEVVSAAHAAAHERGYSLSIMSAKTEELQQRAFAMLSGGVADGVIVAAPPADMLPDLKRLAGAGSPVIVLQHHSPDKSIQAVRVDLEMGGYIATRHLIELGHRRIGHIGNDAQHLQKRRDRTDGYLRALREAGIAMDESLFAAGDTGLGGGFAAMNELLARKPRPTAVFVYNDQMAAGALHALREKGLSAPEDMAIVGFDGIALGQFVSPELTTIDHPREELGRLAVEAVIDRLNGVSDQPRERVLPARLLVRESCGGATKRVEQGGE
ncbi:LacI family DNA-binding transcriptional regulator [Terrarubrum flagellatum]|uniref:LacI family DNA-binding transcriptional regulator n=1 Tax=Terrirubrum flagellatum TaxID=2895980 RepID=UPI003144F70E